MNNMKHIVSFSGGIASFGTAYRVVEKYGKENTILLFADTLIEDEDLYRFIDETVKFLDVKLERIADGRDVWQIFFDVKFLGNSRIDPCSRILKRDLIKKWVKKRYKPNEATIHLGLDWTEEHRLKRVKHNWEPYQIDAPLMWKPFKIKSDLFADLKDMGIEPPRLYAMGFPHNNCGGFCVKAGKANFAKLLEQMPERYAYHENKEQELREYLKKDVTILKQTKKGNTSNVSLKELREQLQANPQMSFMDKIDWGGCGCAI
jgi:hypothetical protein